MGTKLQKQEMIEQTCSHSTWTNHCS